MNSVIRFIIVLAFLSKTLAGYGQMLPQDSALTKGQLSNGLTYYIYQQKDEEQMAVQLFVNAGSLQETNEQRGLAHFLEHMAFNGTRQYPGSSLIEALEKRGVRFGTHLNAHTSYDETIYKLAFDKASLDDLAFAIGVTNEWAYHLTLDSTEIEQEKGIILEEWRSKQGDDRRLSEAYLPLIFRDSRYAVRAPIGDMQVVGGANQALLRDFYNNWYRPDLMAIAIVSPYSPEEVYALIDALVDTPSTNNVSDTHKLFPIREVHKVPLYKDTLVTVMTRDHLSSIGFSYFQIVPAHRHINTEEAYLQSMHRSFFNSLSSGRFAKVIQRGATFKKGSSSISDFLVHHGVVSGSTELYPEEIATGMQEYWTERKRIFDYGFTIREIENFKEQYRAQLERNTTSAQKTPTATLMERLKDDFNNRNTVMSATKRSELALGLIDQIDSVSLVDYVRKTTGEGNMIFMLTAPSALENDVPVDSMLRKWINSIEAQPDLAVWEEQEEHIPAMLLAVQPEPGEIVETNVLADIDATVWRLSNNATVYIKKTDHRKNYIAMSAFRAGGVYALDTGLYLPANHVRPIIGGSGAGSFSRNALSEFLKGNSASATMLISDYREGVAASADMKDVQTMFELMYLKWTQPRIDSVVFKNTKRNLISATQNRADHTPSYLLNERIASALRDDGQPYLGEVTVKRIEQELEAENVMNSYKNRFDGADDFHFVIVGDVDVDSIKSLVLSYIGGLPKAIHSTESIKSGRADGLSVTTGKDMVVIEQTGGEQGKAVVQLYIQTRGLMLDYPGLLAQKAFEEVLKVRLRQRLREENSGVYSVGVSVSSVNVPQPILRTRISFSCDAERREFLTEQVYDVMAEMQDNPAHFESILHNVKQQMLNAHQKEKSTNTFWTSEIRNHVFQEYTNWDFFTAYETMVKNMTEKDVARFLQHHVNNSKIIEARLLP